MKFSHYAFGAFALVALIASSCKSKSVIVQVTPRSLEEVIDGLDSSRIEYNFFSAKAKIKFNGEDAKLGGRSTIRMVRDSLIWMNFKKLSFEGARALIKPDSAWVLYRQDDLYEVAPTQEFLDYHKILRPFDELQELLIGNYPIPSLEEVERFSSRIYHEISFILHGERYEYLVNEDFSIFRASIRDRYGRIVRATFTDYDEHKFATKKDFEIEMPGEALTKISIHLSSIEFNVPKEIRFEIPNHYTRLP